MTNFDNMNIIEITEEIHNHNPTDIDIDIDIKDNDTDDMRVTTDNQTVNIIYNLINDILGNYMLIF